MRRQYLSAAIFSVYVLYFLEALKKLVSADQSGICWWCLLTPQQLCLQVCWSSSTCSSWTSSSFSTKCFWIGIALELMGKGLLRCSKESADWWEFEEPRGAELRAGLTSVLFFLQRWTNSTIYNGCLNLLWLFKMNYNLHQNEGRNGSKLL